MAETTEIEQKTASKEEVIVAIVEAHRTIFERDDAYCRTMYEVLQEMTDEEVMRESELIVQYHAAEVKAYQKATFQVRNLEEAAEKSEIEAPVF